MSNVEVPAPGQPNRTQGAAPDAGGVHPPGILVLSTLFPSSVQPNAGLFIRERMFRVGERRALTVVSPVPWFPLQRLLRWLRPGYRPSPPWRESQQGFTVHYPRFLAFPAILRAFDGLSIALCCLPLVVRLRRSVGIGLIDAHFAYPDGLAAGLLGRWLGLPVTLTLRGTEVPLSRKPLRRRLILAALRRATRVLSVSESLRQHVIGLGADGDKIQVVGNGVDLDKFRPVSRAAARTELALPQEAQVLISVGGLVERKGFHRVIDCLPRLLHELPELHYLVVGGPSGEGDWGDRLREQVNTLGLQPRVHFFGHVAPERLSTLLSAADVFVLATRNEGWANVFLEAMACGLPVVTTDVGGNREVVRSTSLGAIVPFGDEDNLRQALRDALTRDWDRAAIRAYAQSNGWESRVAELIGVFDALTES